MPPTHSFPAMHLFFSPQRHRGGSNDNKPNPIPFSSLCLRASVVQFHLPCFHHRDTEAQRRNRTTTNPIPFPFLLCASVALWFNFISLVFTTETQRHRGGTEREQTQSHSLFFSVPLCLRGSISSPLFSPQRHRGTEEEPNENKPNPSPFSSLYLCASVVQFHLSFSPQRYRDTEGEANSTSPLVRSSGFWICSVKELLAQWSWP